MYAGTLVGATWFVKFKAPQITSKAFYICKDFQLHDWNELFCGLQNIFVTINCEKDQAPILM